MSFWLPVGMAAAGYMLDRQMGGNGLTGAMMGGSLGYGSMGSGGITPSSCCTEARLWWPDIL